MPTGVKIEATPEQLGAVKYDANGLVPAIAQDAENGEVLMVAWMNAETLQLTFDEGRMVYWSRSRQEVWRKGDTSGDGQYVQEAFYDCDADVLLLSIEQRGNVACHTGARSCFYEQGPTATAGGPLAAPPPADVCTELMRVIEGRREQPEPGSYTNRLLEGGDNRILKKIGEEAAEFVMACKDDDGAAIAGEAADLVYHLQVALAHHGVPWRRVQEVLAARRGAPRRG